MPRVHHVKARKDHPDFGIVKGDMCYWWKFNFGPKLYSKTPPKPSQLTRSEFLGTMSDIEDEVSALTADDSLESSVTDIASRLRDLATEQEDKRCNMPEGLQDGETGTMLQDRADKCNEIADELEAITFGDREEEGDEKQSEEDYYQEKLDEVQAIDVSAP